MRGEEFLDQLEHIDSRLIEEAAYDKRTEQKTIKREFHWKKWGAIAAGICILAAGGFVLSKLSDHNLTISGRSHKIQQWNSDYTPSDYFAYNNSKDGQNASGSLSDMMLPYEKTRFYSDERNALEQENVIPVLENYPLFDCLANFNADDSLFSLVFSWHNRDDSDNYSDLTITAGYQEVEQLRDCIEIEIDENGNVAEPSVTVTERDGIRIVAEGSEKQNKTLTFQNASGWYQIEGSWNDSYEDMIQLLDWVWEHPIDFTRFPADGGDEYTYGTLAEYPSAFEGYIPDFEPAGYTKASETLTLKNGEPSAYEASYESENGLAIWWCIDTEPDVYDRKESAGSLESLTQETVSEIRKEEQHITFTWDQYYMKIYIGSDGTAEDLWRLVELIQN